MFDSRFSVGHRTRMAELDPSSVIVAATKDDSNRRNKSTNQMEWEMERTWTGINLDANILCGDATDGDGEEESFQHHLGKKMVNAGSRLSEREREKRTRTEVFEKLATATIITTVFIKWRGYSPPDRWFIRFVHPLMQQPPAMASSPRFGCSSSATRNQGRRRYGRCFLPVSMSTPFSISLSLSLPLPSWSDEFPKRFAAFQTSEARFQNSRSVLHSVSLRLFAVSDYWICQRPLWFIPFSFIPPSTSGSQAITASINNLNQLRTRIISQCNNSIAIHSASLPATHSNDPNDFNITRTLRKPSRLIDY